MMTFHKCCSSDGIFSNRAEDSRAIWSQLNNRYFAGRLSPIEIVWSSRLTSSAGMFASRVGPRHPSHDPGRRVIKLSAPLLSQQHERETVSTLAHEMIHQWQYDVLKRRPSHGAGFIHKMKEMNRDGLGITLCHTFDDAVQALCQHAWLCADCGRLYHRQRRTIHPRHHRCGVCRGILRELSATAAKGHREQATRLGRARMAGSAKLLQLELRFPPP